MQVEEIGIRRMDTEEVLHALQIQVVQIETKCKRRLMQSLLIVTTSQHLRQIRKT